MTAHDDSPVTEAVRSLDVRWILPGPLAVHHQRHMPLSVGRAETGDGRLHLLRAMAVPGAVSDPSHEETVVLLYG